MSNVTLLELFYLRIYPLGLINLMTPAKLAPDLETQGHLKGGNIVIFIMFEADIHFRPLQTTLIDIYKVFEPLVCRFKGIWVLIPLHWQSYPPRFWKSGSLEESTWSHNVMVEAEIHLSLLHTSIVNIQHVRATGIMSQGHVGAPLYRCTGQVDPRFGKSGSLKDWKWCHDVMVKADIHLKPLHTSHPY